MIRTFKRLFGRRNPADYKRPPGPDAVTQIVNLAQEVSGESVSRGEVLRRTRKGESSPLPGVFDPVAYQREKIVRQARQQACPPSRGAAWWDRQLPET